jgi:hypothetical protein
MQTAFIRWLAALLATLTLTGCGPQPKPFPAKTPEEIKQLTEVTDRTLALIRNPKDRTAVRQALAALDAASAQYEQHVEAIRTLENAEVLACIRSQSMNVLDLEILLARRDEAERMQDGPTLKRRDGMLWLLSQDVGTCAATSSQYLISHEERPEALKHGAVLVSEIYATLAIFRAGSGLRVASFLRQQIRDYETLIKKLGPGQEVPGVTDALPKLKETLAALESDPSYNEPAAGQLDQ